MYTLPKFKKSETPDHIYKIYENIPLDFLLEKFLEENKRFVGDAIRIKEIKSINEEGSLICYTFILTTTNKYYDKVNPVELEYYINIDESDLEILIRRHKLNNLDI